MEYARKNPNSHEIELHMCNVSKGSWKLIKRTASAHTGGDFGKALQRVCTQAVRTRQEMPRASKTRESKGAGREQKRIQAVPLSASIIQTFPRVTHSGKKNDISSETDSVGAALTPARLALKCTRAHARGDPSVCYWRPLVSLELLYGYHAES